MRALRLSALIAALLAVGCDDAVLVPARPVTIELTNQSGGALFLAADHLSFHLLDSGGVEWRPDGYWAPLCSDCEEACDSDTHGDPSPVWLEVPAGEAASLSWQGRLYRVSETPCGCGYQCLEVAAFDDGDYELVLEYELELPEGWGPYYPMEREDGLPGWRGAGMGWAYPQQSHTYPFTFEGQPSLVLVFEG